MKWLSDLATALGGVVDAFVPSWQGYRTKIAVVACPVLGWASPFVPAEYRPLVGVVQGVLCAAAPAFALAGLVRK